MTTRFLIVGSDSLTLNIIINFDIIWHVIFYWFKIGFMTIFCKKFWTFCFSGDFILEEEGTQVFRVHTVFFSQYVQIIFLVQRSIKAAVYFQNFVTKIGNYRSWKKLFLGFLTTKIKKANMLISNSSATQIKFLTQHYAFKLYSEKLQRSFSCSCEKITHLWLCKRKMHK